MSNAIRLAEALADRYRIERELGAGGMATVYLANDLKHHRQVAIKVLRPDLAASLGAERFLREIDTTANLRHPHILPLFDSGDAGGFLFYVMPLVEGESLRARLTRERQLPIDDALRIAREVSDALSYAHARGVIHRDIKPENILLESGHAVVADFGIARAIRAAGDDSLTRTGVSVGTPAYMSPEQAAGDQALDGRSDLYALGCVLYEMLAGQPPFTGPTAESITRQHLIAEPPPVTNLRPAVPATVMSALQRALAKVPADRFNPVAQFAEALRAGEAAALPPSTAGARPAPRRATWRLPAISAAVVVIAVAAFILWRQASSRVEVDSASVAVLPFADLSPDRTSAYLGDGVAETLISALGKVQGLEVAGRTSAFSLRDKAGDVRVIGRQLGVATVLEGSVQRAGERLRITAQLIRTADRRLLWSEVFDRAAGDIFAVQDEVARAVVNALQVRQAAGRDSVVGLEGTRNAAAYDAYLLGRYHWNKRTTEGMLRAEASFQAAIRADSNYAQAWSGLADTYSLLIPSEYGPPGINRDSVLTLAERAARRAVVLAPQLGEAHISFAQVTEERGNWADALQAYERGVALSPGYATGHQWYSYHLWVRNRMDESIREMETARRLDPLSHVIVISLAADYDAVERFADAAPGYAQGFELAPDAWWALILFCNHQLVQRGLDGAAPCYRRLLLASGTDSTRAADTERALRDPARRDSTVNVIIRSGPLEAVPLFKVLRGDEAVIAYLRALVTSPRRNDFNKAILATVLGSRLRADPRVQALLVQLGYPKWDGGAQ